MNIRLSLLKATDVVLTASIVGLVLGTSLAFGGAVWWAGLMIAVLSTTVVLAGLTRMLLAGSMRVLKSPLTLLGLMSVGLGVVQLAPLPGTLASRLSPNSRTVYSRGVLERLARADDPAQDLPEAAPTVALDARPLGDSTVAGRGDGVPGLVLGVSQFSDRLSRLYLVWGCIIAAFFINTAFAVVQVGCQSGGLYGLYQPGKGPSWGPTVDDLANVPTTTVLRNRAVATDQSGSLSAWATLEVDRPFLFGSLMGGAGAYLALGSLGMPLAMAVILQLMAPRGSREWLWTRLGNSGQGSLVVLLLGLLMAAAVLTGLLAGPLASLPFAVGLAVVGLPGAWSTGLRWGAVGLTVVMLLALAGGNVLGDVWARFPESPPPVVPVPLAASSRVWSDALAMILDFPLVGTGLGTFATVEPCYKSRDASTTSAMSSLLQWWVESGAVGLSLLIMALGWCLYRLPGAVRRVGTADRSLVFGLIGAATSFSLFSAVHWTVELSAVAMAASAWGGTCNRWLSGGTDLFVERG